MAKGLMRILLLVVCEFTFAPRIAAENDMSNLWLGVDVDTETPDIPIAVRNMHMVSTLRLHALQASTCWGNLKVITHTSVLSSQNISCIEQKHVAFILLYRMVDVRSST